MEAILTTEPGHHHGPHFPHGEAGRSSVGAWMTFHEGQDIRCPGTRHDRRERQRDTERRADPRLGPCHHRWGRVGAGCETWIRVRRQGQPPMGVPSALLDCPTCHQPIELATIAASKAA